MKKLLLTTLFIFVCIFAFAQEEIIFSSGQQDYFLCENAILVDDGGGFGLAYSADFSGILTIHSTSANPINLEFVFFELSSGDYLKIYDGTSIGDSLIGSFSGASLFNSTITSTNSSITLQFLTDNTNQNNGFYVELSTEYIAGDLIAEFSYYPDELIVNYPIFFINESSQAALAIWDFGNGDSSNISNPIYTFEETGSQQISLTVFDCDATNTATVSQTIFIPDYPLVSWEPDSLSVVMLDTDTLNEQITLSNSGGPSRISTFYSQDEPINIYVPSEDNFDADDVEETLEELSADNSNLNFLVESHYSLEQMMDFIEVNDVHIILMYGRGFNMEGTGDFLFNFINEGGSLVFCDRNTSIYEEMAEDLEGAGLLNIDDRKIYGSTNSTMALLTINSLNHPVTYPFFNTATFPSPSLSRAILVNDLEYVSLISDDDGYSLLGYKNLGKGKVIYNGNRNLSASIYIDVFNNSLEFADPYYHPNWLSINPSDTLTINNEQVLDLTFVPQNLNKGLHEYTLSVFTNDTTNSIINIPVKLNVEYFLETNFEAIDPTTCEGSVQFIDETLNNPSEWYWDFGDGMTSQEENPLHIYQESGVYNVSLVSCNHWGCDTMFFEDYIKVDYSGRLCDTLYFENQVSQEFYNVCSDLILSPFGTNNEYFEGFITLHAPSKGKINLKFNVPNDENCCGGITIFRDELDNTIQTRTYSIAELQGLEVISIYDRLILKMEADAGETIPQIEITVGIVGGYKLPQAFFHMPDTIGYLNYPFPFFNQSTDSGAYQWDFGDGSVSYERNPEHNYTSSGTYTITMIAENCIGSDTISKQIYIPVAPSISWNPDSLNVDIYVGDTLSKNFSVFNDGVGRLVSDPQAINIVEPYEKNVLVMDPTMFFPDFLDEEFFFVGANQVQERLIDQFPNHNFIPFWGAVEKLSESIEEYNPQTIIIISNSTKWSDFKMLIADFIQAGGKVLFCTEARQNGNSIMPMLEYQESEFSDTLNTSIVEHPITSFMEDSIIYQFNKWYGSALFDEENYVSLIDFQTDYSICGYQSLPIGELFYQGFKPNVNDLLAFEIFENTVGFLLSTDDVKWLDVRPKENAILENNEEQMYEVFFDARRSVPGTYNFDFMINTNDLTKEVVIPIELNILSKLNPGFSYNDLEECNGVLQFNDLSAGAPEEWLWDFGDGVFSEEQNPVHSYLEQGAYTVQLTVRSGFDYNVISETINVENPLQIDLEFPSVVGQYELLNYSFGGLPVVKEAFWDFGDSTLISGQEVVHAYSDTGTYFIQWNITTADECVYNFNQSIKVVAIDSTRINEVIDFMLFPNPTNNEVYLDFYHPLTKYKQLNVYNTIGKIVFKQSIEVSAHQEIIQLDEWAKGVYFVELITLENERVIKKLFLY